jgi:heat shock protein HslJ
MKPPYLPAILGVALTSLLACVPEQGVVNASSDLSDLENVEWKLTELDGAPLAATQRPAPTLKLSSKERQASGFAGCNRFTGGYELVGEQLRFNALATTRMACPDPTPEAALLKALDQTASWRVAGRTLELSDATPMVRSRWTVTAIESGGQR